MMNKILWFIVLTFLLVHIFNYSVIFREKNFLRLDEFQWFDATATAFLQVKQMALIENLIINYELCFLQRSTTSDTSTCEILYYALRGRRFMTRFIIIKKCEPKHFCIISCSFSKRGLMRCAFFHLLCFPSKLYIHSV